MFLGGGAKKLFKSSPSRMLADSSLPTYDSDRLLLSQLNQRALTDNLHMNRKV